jgi:hypothetical protein
VYSEIQNFEEESYNIPHEIRNIKTLHKKTIEDVERGNEVLNTISRIVPDFKLYDEEQMVPTDLLKTTDIDNFDLKIEDYKPQLLTIIPNELEVEEDEVKNLF